MKVDIGRQLMININNQVGSLAEVTHLLAEASIDLIAICAYEIEGNVMMMFVTADNNLAKTLLEESGYTVREEEVILLSLANKPGVLQDITNKIARAEIQLKLLYGGADQDMDVSQNVIITDNNLDAIMVIKMELERS